MVTEKKYKCSRCGFGKMAKTNHNGNIYGTYIEGKKYNWCRVCPSEPHHSPPYCPDTPTTWNCVDNKAQLSKHQLN